MKGEISLKLIFSMLCKHFFLFCAGILFLAGEAACDLFQPALMSHIVDDGVKQGNPHIILFFGLFMLATAAVGAACAVMRSILSATASQLVAKELRSLLYRKIQTFSFANMDRFPPAALLTRMTNDVTQIQRFINGLMRILVKAPFTCIGAVFMIVTRTPQLTPVLVGILSGCIVLTIANMVYGFPRYQRMQQCLDRLNRVSRQFLNNIRVVKAFGREKEEEDRFGSSADALAQAGIQAQHVSAAVTPMIHLIVNLGIIALFLLSRNEPPNHVGRMMASVTYLTQMTFSLNMVSSIFNTMARASASAARIQEILTEQPAMKSPWNPLPISLDQKEQIEFQDVTFFYPGAESAVLHHISFSIGPGLTGIIGPTGSGKSTLARLLPRFYDPESGHIFIGGVDAREQNPSALRQMVGFVPQQAAIFSGTIRENLLWGNPDASEEAIQKAAQMACADRFIEALPEKYDTRLGQGGVNLSGGQKQRLCIARAFLRQPRLFILDDCTSALDAATEAAVLNNLTSYGKQGIVILISQRVPAVMGAGQILCLEKGQLCGQGTHQELLKHCEVYQEIYHSQIGDDVHG